MNPLGIDDGLWDRLRSAADAIVWTTAARKARGRKGPTQIARLYEEEAQLRLTEGEDRTTLEATAGPVGALLLLLECERRGVPAALGGRNPSTDPAFPDGSIVAQWGDGALPADSKPSVRDLVELARYALR